MLQASRDKNGVYVEPWRFEQMENTMASQGNQVQGVAVGPLELLCGVFPSWVRIVSSYRKPLYFFLFGKNKSKTSLSKFTFLSKFLVDVPQQFEKKV